MKFSMSSGQRHQKGVGLIEVLVAVLVVSIGFLGVAALQAMSLSTNNSAMARSMATIASYSILDAMRSDRASAVATNYNTTVTASNCGDAGATLATHQLHLWCQELAAAHLGKADKTTGQVNCNINGYCVITITFDDSRAGGDDAQTVVTRASL